MKLLRTIRERISVEQSGGLVPADRLNILFWETRGILDESVRMESDRLGHFKVFASLAFTLFAEESVDIAIIEMINLENVSWRLSKDVRSHFNRLGWAVHAMLQTSSLALSLLHQLFTSIGEEHLDALGGSLESIAVAKSGIIKKGRPVRWFLAGYFSPQIECILREKALAMNSPVVAASDASSRSAIKHAGVVNCRLYQLCDIVLHVQGDSQPYVELLDLKISMLGGHQLQNDGLFLTHLLELEETYLLGRNHLLTPSQAASLGLDGTTILLDEAHTKDYAKALVNTIRLAVSDPAVALVVAMAMDKDHVAFAKEFLSGTRVEAVFLTEVGIAGASSRSMPSTLLRDRWIHASEELGISVLHDRMPEYSEAVVNDDRVVIGADSSLANSVQAANRILKRSRK